MVSRSFPSQVNLENYYSPRKERHVLKVVSRPPHRCVVKKIVGESEAKLLFS